MKRGTQRDTVEELCEEADPASPVDHLIVCPDCGQIFDCRDDGEIQHHAVVGHLAKL